MARIWEPFLNRWVAEGLLERSVAERIRAHEMGREPARGLHWPVVLALAFGGILLAAGILLFVAAHWDRVSPGARFALVLAMVGVFHAAGALAARGFPAAATTLHAVGTGTLGAGIFLAGQIFNLREHWPGAIMLWSLGAWIGWALRRDWAQATLAALLTPTWLASEWLVAADRFQGSQRILSEGLLLLALTYLSARLPDRETPLRRSLAWCGGLALLPCAVALFFLVGEGNIEFWYRGFMPSGLRAAGWAGAVLAPLGLAWLLRGRAAWVNLVAAGWVFVFGLAVEQTALHPAGTRAARLGELLTYFWCAAGAVGLVGWGLWERRRERLNLGVAGFALTVLGFYFSSVMDKLGRSASLVGLGALFLLGGWLLEKTRRRLLHRLVGGGGP